MENGIFAAQKSGKRSLKVKWEKNAFRTVVVVVCALIAWFGAADLDKFVSLIGSLAWCVSASSRMQASRSYTLTALSFDLMGSVVAQRPARVDLPGALALEGVRPEPETKSRRHRAHRLWGRRDYLYYQADGAFCPDPSPFSPRSVEERCKGFCLPCLAPLQSADSLGCVQIELLLSPSDAPASPKPHCPPRRS